MKQSVRLLAPALLLTILALPTALERDAGMGGGLEADSGAPRPPGPEPTAAAAAAAAAGSPTATAPAHNRRAIPPEMRERIQAVMKHLETRLPGMLERRRKKERFSPRRQLLLEAAGVLRRVPGTGMTIAGVEHQPYVVHKQGLPFFNRRGRLHFEDGQPTGRTGPLSFPPLAAPEWVDAGVALAAAYDHVGVAGLRAPPRSERGWFAADGVSLPTWKLTIPASDPFGTWQVIVDGATGEVRSSVNLIRSVDGTGRVYDPNPVVAPTPVLVPLQDLDGSGQLFGDITRIIDDQSPGAYRPDLIFDFPTTDPRFVQTSVYRGLTDTALFAVQHGFPTFPVPVLALTNLLDPQTSGPLNNAFYDPFFPRFLFGNGDGVILDNLGVDLDVAAHEMGHHVFEVLVQPFIFTGTEPAMAMTEGVADSFGAWIGGDPNVGESTVPGQPYLRTVLNTRSFPGDVFTDPHETGLIYAGANWDLSQLLGQAAYADILIAGLPFMPSSPAVVDYRDAILQGDQVLNAGANAAAIQAEFVARGFDSMEDLPEFQGWLGEGTSPGSIIPDASFHLYLFDEFPESDQIDVATFDAAPAADADLVVGRADIFDINDGSTYLFSQLPATSNESVQFTASTTPSVNDENLWAVFVIDWADGFASGYTVTADATLPQTNVTIDGAPVVGTISVQGEIQIGAFSGSAGQVVRAEVESLSSTLDPLVVIVDPEDFSVLGADDDSGPGTDALIEGALLPATGVYTAWVLSPIADVDPTVGTGDFRLTLTTCNNTGTNTDGDALVDACDPDNDNDGVPDAFDSAAEDELVCEDIDSDSCDDCASGSGPDIVNDGTDTDFDILCDAGDPDDDNDGCPDPDDAAPLVPSPDGDLDFLGDDCDNCPADANANQTDTDDDGDGDACDVDDDGDGLDDAVETNTGTYVSPSDTGSDPLLFDSDGDGFGDGFEVDHGSDPNDAASTPPPATIPALSAPAAGMLALGLALAAAALGAPRRRRE